MQPGPRTPALTGYGRKESPPNFSRPDIRYVRVAMAWLRGWHVWMRSKTLGLRFTSAQLSLTWLVHGVSHHFDKAWDIFFFVNKGNDIDHASPHSPEWVCSKPYPSKLAVSCALLSPSTRPEWPLPWTCFRCTSVLWFTLFLLLKIPFLLLSIYPNPSQLFLLQGAFWDYLLMTYDCELGLE